MRRRDIDSDILDNHVLCEDCGDVYTLYSESNIFRCKPCAYTNTLKSAKKLTPEFIRGVLDKYRND